ncbi:MAG: TraB/GumN family protein [Nitrospiraceae bacterium]|nr:MAG: TraB/GumN family protein [Nitrospiraceae bacterium]
MLYSRRPGYCLPVVLACLIAFWGWGAAADIRGNPADLQKHFLWALEHQGKKIYILGSIHLLKEDSYPLPEAIEKIYHCCRTVVFETDLDAMEEAPAQQAMMKKALYPPGETLARNISGDTYGLLEERLRKAGLAIDRFERFRPWYITLALASAELQRLGFDPRLGIDRYFFTRAAGDGREMIFLETGEYQMNLFAGLGKRKQERLLIQVMKELDIIEENFAEMSAYWRSGDAVRLGAFMAKSFEGYPDLYRRFITSRNKKWVSGIEGLLKKDGDVLMVVGAAHLAGKESLIDLLRQQGYEVRQR